MSVSNKKIMTAQEVSKYLRISLSTVHHLTRAGKIKSVKVGKQWQYDKADIDAYLESGYEFLLEKAAYGGDERRFYERIACMIQGFAVISSSPVKSWEANGNVLNFSKAGILFEVSDPYMGTSPDLHVGAPVNVKLYLPSSDTAEYALEGSVAHCSPGSPSRFGMKFSDLDPELAEIIGQTV
ncbi:MAG: helix-turn-helix domain-containing protein [Candidatus Omnitrophota bacterium]|nr:helix-turn-helix domain-containing protein [Candidatus Omnitrophota bacterium]